MEVEKLEARIKELEDQVRTFQDIEAIKKLQSLRLLSGTLAR
jgi:hypothetical protein